MPTKPTDTPQDSHMLGVSMTQKTYERIVDWLLTQGISTVLLCAILAFLGYGIVYMVPAHLEQIQGGYREVTNQTTQSLEKTTGEFTRSLDKLVESHDKERDMFIEWIRAERQP